MFSNRSSFSSAHPSAGRSRQATPSRRGALCWLAAVPLGVAMLAAGTQAAWAKAKKAAVRYQDEPKKDRNCNNCRHFEPPNACKLVEGEVSPNGWCTVWSKAKS